MSVIKPIKHLGQNFLLDKNIANKIVNSLDITENDYIIEIGPGEGALTELLLNKTQKLSVVEIDRRAVDLLRLKFPTLDIIFNDFLKIELNSIFEKYPNNNYKIIGNIPYYISSEIFFKLFENSNQISKSVLMIQKEVAQRFTANPRTKQYGILSIAVALCGNSKILFDVHPSSFYPKPNVTSSVIEFNFDDSIYGKKHFSEIMKFVRAAFNQRRKKLSNSLKSYTANFTNSSDIFSIIKNNEKYRKFLDKRAEELTKDDFVDLYLFIDSLRK